MSYRHADTCLHKEVDGTELFPQFLEDPYPFFLDSGIKSEKLGRYSIMGSDPFLVFYSRGSDCFVQHLYGNQNTYHMQGNPLELLQKTARRFTGPPDAAGELPFTGGGAVGYLSYDLGCFLEGIPDTSEDDLQLPHCYFAFYDSAVVIDHLKGESHLVSTGLPFNGKEKEKHRENRYRQLLSRLNSIENSLHCGQESMETKTEGEGEPAGKNLRSNFDRETYLKAVEKVLDYINKGEISQINLSQRMQVDLDTSPWELYQRLRRVSPAPFASYLDFPPVTVVSSSPERFLKQEGSKIEACPIKGTRRRGYTPEEDEKLKKELWNSKKERTELAMIANMEKEELSRFCRENSVEISELYRLESYATVHHLVSTVEGLLPEGKELLDVLHYTLPGGSISGTPKRRSLEIIEELEPCKRGIYTGTLGYMDFQGFSDLSVVIRTFVIKNQVAYFNVGGGLVAASDPGQEYQETLDKARGMLWALGIHSRSKRQETR